MLQLMKPTYEAPRSRPIGNILMLLYIFVLLCYTCTSYWHMMMVPFGYDSQNIVY